MENGLKEDIVLSKCFQPFQREETQLFAFSISFICYDGKELFKGCC